VPFAQIFQVKCEVEGESLGILTHSSTPEIKEIIAGSPAAQAGINPKAQCSCPLILLIEDSSKNYCVFEIYS
jgi:hypothetical protein